MKSLVEVKSSCGYVLPAPFEEQLVEGEPLFICTGSGPSTQGVGQVVEPFQFEELNNVLPLPGI